MVAQSRVRRVLFLVSQPFFQWRGSPIRVAYDVQALAALGYEVDLLVLPVGEPRALPGVRIRRVPNVFLARNVSIGPSLLKAAFDAVMFFQALGLALRQRYDVIHGVEDAGAVGLAVAGLTGARLVFEKHSDPTSYRKGALRNAIMSAYAAVERFVARRAAAVIGTGPGLAAQVRDTGTRADVYDIMDIPSSRVEATPDATAAARARLQRKADDVLVTYVGSFAVYQGVDLMFEAIPLVVGQCPRARFVIVGGSPDEIEARRAQLAAVHCADAVHFAGKIPPDELPDTLAASDILLSPRTSGVNTPLKILDYFKAGGAIVATDVEANRLLLDEALAELTPPTPRAFADGIGRLVNDEGRRRALAARGRGLVETTYNFDVFTTRLGACYKKVLAD
jgi:glycosyltransferase involved in cell wall biosynthesis